MVAIWGVDSRLYLAVDEDGTVFTTVSFDEADSPAPQVMHPVKANGS